MRGWQKQDQQKTIGDGIGHLFNLNTIPSARCILSYHIEELMLEWPRTMVSQLKIPRLS